MIENVTSRTQLVEDIQRLLEGVNKAVQVDGREFRITASAGIAVFPKDGEDLDTLICHADRAMYYAKDMGRNGVRLYLDIKSDQFSQRFRSRLNYGKPWWKNNSTWNFKQK